MPAKPAIPASAFAQTADHKKWARVGIPRELWPILPTHKPKFSSYKIPRGPVVSAINQRQIFTALTKEIRHNHPVVVVFSEPTDDAAVLIAASIVATYLGANYPAEYYDLSFGSQIVFRKRPRVVALHNLMLSSPSYRFQTARDMIIRWRDALRVIAIGGVPKDPEGWWRTNIRYRGTYYLVAKDVLG